MVKYGNEVYKVQDNRNQRFKETCEEGSHLQWFQVENVRAFPSFLLFLMEAKCVLLSCNCYFQLPPNFIWLTAKFCQGCVMYYIL